MDKFEFFVFVNPAEGQDDQFNEWYMSTHMPDVLKVPGFVAGQRFELAHAQRTKPPHPWKYMTVFQIETGDLRATLDELKSRANTPAMPLSSSLGDRIAYVFKAITPKITTAAYQ